MEKNKNGYNVREYTPIPENPAEEDYGSGFSYPCQTDYMWGRYLGTRCVAERSEPHGHLLLSSEFLSKMVQFPVRSKEGLKRLLTYLCSTMEIEECQIKATLNLPNLAQLPEALTDTERALLQDRVRMAKLTEGHYYGF